MAYLGSRKGEGQGWEARGQGGKGEAKGEARGAGGQGEDKGGTLSHPSYHVAAQRRNTKNITLSGGRGPMPPPPNTPLILKK